MSNMNTKTIKYLTGKYDLSNLNESSLKDFLQEVEEISTRVPRKEKQKYDFLHLTGINGWKERVAFYNQVVKNVNTKLRVSLENVLIPDNAKVVGLKDLATGTMYPLENITLTNFPEVDDKLVVVFSYEISIMGQNYRFKTQNPVLKTEYISIPYVFFRNDPIGVAIHIRSLASAQTEKNIQLDITEGNKRVDDLRKQLERAEQMVKESIVYSEKIATVTKRKTERKNKRLKNKEQVIV